MKVDSCFFGGMGTDMTGLRSFIQNLPSFNWHEHLNWFATASLIAAFACLLVLIYSALAFLLAKKSLKVEENLVVVLTQREKSVRTNSLSLLNPILAPKQNLKTDGAID